MESSTLDSSTKELQNRQVDDFSNNVEKYRLSPLERAAVLSIIEEYTNALAIYRYAFGKPSTRANVHIDLVPTKARPSEPTRTQLFGRDVNAALRDLKIQDAFHKLQDDSFYVEKLLENTKVELRKCGEFTTLSNEIESILTNEEREKTLLLKCEEAEKSIARLRRTIAEETSTNERDKKLYEDTLFHTQNEIKRLESKAEAETKYVSAWEKARCEQNSLRCSITLERLNEDLRKCCVEEKNEERIMANLEEFVEQNIDFNKREIDRWQCWYDKELEKYAVKICKLRNEIESNRRSVGRLKEEYWSKQEFIDTYLAEKETIRKRKEHEEHMRISAVRIQAWWRGVMVRRKLGPYRPQERKKKRVVKSKK